MSKDMNMTVLFDFYRNILTEKQVDVIDLYYNEDLSLAEISEHLGITRQGVRDNIKRAEAAMLEMEEGLGLVKRYEQVQEVVGKISDEIAALEKLEQTASAPWISAHLIRIKSLLSQIEE